MMDKVWMLIPALLGLWFIISALSPNPGELATNMSQGPSGMCPAEVMDAREKDHAYGVKMRADMVTKWAPGGSISNWDADAPMDTAEAWNAPTVWDVWSPTYGCLRPVHIGGVAGSKWGTSLPLETKVVCNPQFLKEATRKCVVYSFGVGWDTTFEQAILRLAPHCTVRVFDPTMEPTKFYELVAQQALDGETPPAAPRLNFNKVGLAAQTTDNYSEGMLWNNVQSIKVMTLEDIMRSQGDSHLTILKVDIEGSEWKALHQAVGSGAMAKAEQLLLEVHMGGCETGYKQNNRGKLDSLFTALESAGLRAFSQVPNLVPVSKSNFPGCSEFSFIHHQSSFAKRSCGA